MMIFNKIMLRKYYLQLLSLNKMIISFKAKNKKQQIIKIVSLILLVFMLVVYYFYMSNQFSQTNTQTKLIKVPTNKTLAKKKKKLEKLIYNEIETLVNLIGQKHIKKIKIVSNKVLILCDVDANLDALKIRYGVMALIKKTSKDIKIAIDVQKIIENKYNVK